MSKKEMQDLDEQILEVANRSGESRRSEDAHNAEQEERKRKLYWEEEERKEKMLIAAEERRKAKAKMVLRATGCLLAAAAFVLLLVVPEAVPVIGYGGVLIFSCTCAIIVDRHIRRGR